MSTPSEGDGEAWLSRLERSEIRDAMMRAMGPLAQQMLAGRGSYAIAAGADHTVLVTAKGKVLRLVCYYTGGRRYSADTHLSRRGNNFIEICKERQFWKLGDSIYNTSDQNFDICPRS